MIHKVRLSGACCLAAILCLIAGIVPRFIPSANPLGAMMRMFDSVPFWMFALAVLFGFATWGSGARKTGIGLVSAAVLASGFTILDHRALSLPPTPDVVPDLRIVFFNIYDENILPVEDIVTAVQSLGPDLVVFAEPSQMGPMLPHLGQSFRIMAGCDLSPCDLLIATHLVSQRHWMLSLNPVFGDRYGVIELETDSGKTVLVSIVHLLKPWMSDVSQSEWDQLRAQYTWLSGPVVAVGDFNTAPWSRPMRALLDDTGFRALRRPPGTWPTQAGRWGLPIDQVLVKGGARVVSVTAFGDTLGSNHRGLVIDVALPADP